VKKRADIAEEELSVVIEVNKNLNYSLKELAEEKPEVVQLQRIEQLKR